MSTKIRKSLDNIARISPHCFKGRRGHLGVDYDVLMLACSVLVSSFSLQGQPLAPASHTPKQGTPGWLSPRPRATGLHWDD